MQLFLILKLKKIIIKIKSVREKISNFTQKNKQLAFKKTDEEFVKKDLPTRKCSFCGSPKQTYIYDMNGFAIYQCKNCLNVYTANMPSKETLKKFYDGFLFFADKENKKLLTQERFKNWFDSFKLKPNAKMLDVGGGGGFFSYAFEYFSKGEATYIDLDAQACEFAKKEVGLKNVINADVADLPELTDKKYDFIYSRHLIEHLTEPTEFINNVVKLLADDGVFVLQFPNGLSFERIIEDDHRNIRIQLLKTSNSFSTFDSLKILLSKKTAFGLDPIRHLWAITPRAMKMFLSKNRAIEFKVKEFSINDDVYSPWRPYKNDLKTRFKRNVLSKILGGAHLVCIIKKKEEK